MVHPVDLGALTFAPLTSPEARKRKGFAVLPGTSSLREMDLFDARPSQNARVDVVTGENSSLRYLRLARWTIQQGGAPLSYTLPSDAEAVLYVNRGNAHVDVNGETLLLGKGDVVYAGLGSEIVLRPGDFADVSEFQAVHCKTQYPTQVIRHAEIEQTPLAAHLGTRRPMSRRTVYKLVDQNVQACRLLFGDTFMAQAGGIGSYPPHFHGPDGPAGMGANAKEELYHFRMESDLKGVTPFVLQNCARPGEAVDTYVHLFDDTVIDVTPGYHDTLAPPHVRFSFTWCLAAFTEGVRDWSVIFDKPGFENEW